MDTLRAWVEDVPGAHWVPTQLEDGTLGPSAWVPYGPGFEIPLTFDYDGEGPFSWQMTVFVIEGRPKIVYFECWTLDPLRTVTPEALHRFPLGRFLEEATLMASRPEDEVPRTFKRWKNVDEVRAARAAVLAHHRKRPSSDQRQAITDAFLAEVADVYRRHVPTGKPSKAVAEHFHYSGTSARRIVREARLRGFLGPARPGRGGEQSKEETR
jgi:hypothetical protein